MMKNLIHEIHRRSLWQVLGIYVAGSWFALQVVNEVADSVALPDWISGAAVVLLILGFPIVLGTAFVQEGVGRETPSDGETDEGGSAGTEPSVVGTMPASTQNEAPFSAVEAMPASAPADSEPGPVETAPASVPAKTPVGVHHRLLTWRHAVIGGVTGFALLGLATAGYIVTRTLGIGPAATLVAQGLLDETDRILLADFTNRTTDSLLAGVVTEALRVDLAQSNVVRLAEQSLVAAALDRMERPSDTPIDPTLARLLAQREGIKAVLSGEIGAAGSSYVLSAQLVEPAQGTVLFSHRETAGGLDEVIDAIDRLSRHIRERIGESLGSLRAALPLERVTTSDLEALRLYTQAIRAIEFEGDDDRGLALLDEAVGLDPRFAAAYRKIGVTLSNRREQRDRLITALTKAYENRERLTQSERYMTIAAYHGTVTGDLQQSVSAYENLLESDPEYYPALNNLGIVYYRLGNLDGAEELYLRAAAVDVSSPFPYLNAVWPQVQQGRFDDAWATLDSLDRYFPGYPTALEYRSKVSIVEGNYETAIASLTDLLEIRAGDLLHEGLAHRVLAAIAATRGQVGLADAHFASSESAEETRGIPGAVLDHALARAWIDLQTRRDTAAAARRLEAALTREPLETLPAADRPYLEIADLHASMGQVDRARALVAEYEAAIPAEARGRGNDLLRSQAFIAILEDRTEDALDLVRRSDQGGCAPCAMPYYMAAYEAAAMPDSAIAAYERYVDLTWLDRIYFDEAALPLSLERLGQLYDEKGDLQNAAKYYAAFVELWAEADEELQPRVRAAQGRLEEILRERG